MATKRRRFTAQFKAKVATEALRGDRTIQAIAAKHEVHPNQVSGWKRQAQAGLEEVFAGADRVSSSTVVTPCFTGHRTRCRTLSRITVQVMRVLLSRPPVSLRCSGTRLKRSNSKQWLTQPSG